MGFRVRLDQIRKKWGAKRETMPKIGGKSRISLVYLMLTTFWLLNFEGFRHISATIHGRIGVIDPNLAGVFLKMQRCLRLCPETACFAP